MHSLLSLKQFQNIISKKYNSFGCVFYLKVKGWTICPHCRVHECLSVNIMPHYAAMDCVFCQMQSAEILLNTIYKCVIDGHYSPAMLCTMTRIERLLRLKEINQS